MSRLDTLLAGLGRDRLHGLLVRLVQREPSLLETIERELRSGQDDDTGRQPVLAPADLNAARLQTIRTLHHPPTHTGRGWYIFHLGPEAAQLLEQAWEMIRTGDGRNAMEILNVMTDECLQNWQSIMEDEEGETLSFVQEELAPAWVEAILSTDLTPGEREGWEVKLDGWASDLADYVGSESFEVALRALEEGWDEPELRRIVRGEDSQRNPAPVERYQDLAIQERLTVARLHVLERRQRYDEYLNLARAKGQVLHYALMLVRQGHAAAAVQYAVAHLQRAEDALTLAQELREAGRPEDAARIAERGLALEGEKAALGTWLANVAAGLGQQDLALSATRIAFLEATNLSTYVLVQELAGTSWPIERDELLNRLRRTNGFHLQGPVDIVLHEGLVADAIALVDRSSYPFPDLIRQVAGAAIETHPDWVIQSCSKQAAAIMDTGKSAAYGKAVDWLALAKRAYVAAGRTQEWQEYLDGLLEMHRRKYRLMPLLQDLRNRD